MSCLRTNPGQWAWGTGSMVRRNRAGAHVLARRRQARAASARSSSERAQRAPPGYPHHVPTKRITCLSAAPSLSAHVPTAAPLRNVLLPNQVCPNRAWSTTAVLLTGWYHQARLGRAAPCTSTASRCVPGTLRSSTPRHACPVATIRTTGGHSRAYAYPSEDS